MEGVRIDLRVCDCVWPFITEIRVKLCVLCRYVHLKNIAESLNWPFQSTLFSISLNVYVI